MPSKALEEADPPVVASFSGPVGWTLPAELSWTQSHTHLSGFLDDLTYLRAFNGGAVHGGWTELDLPENPSARQVAWLEENWSKATVSPMVFGGAPPNMIINVDPWPILYVRDGQALYWEEGVCRLAVREADTLDEISRRFQIKWARRW